MKKHLLFVLLFCGLFFASQAQWTEQATAFTAASRGIRFISAVDTNIVWATAYDGSTSGAPEIQEFTRTTNGGTTWTPGAISGYSGWGLSMICAVSDLKAWVPAWNPAGGGTILYTADGGATWTPQSTAVFSAPSGFPNVVHFWDENNGFCMGDPNGGYFEIYTTTDGGTTWTRVPQADIPANLASEWGTVGLYSVVGDYVWFTTGKGRVYKSIDRGYHWTVAATPNTANQLQISMRSINCGIVKMNESPYTSYQTVDGGSTWTLHSPLGNFYGNDFTYIPGTAASYISVGADLTNAFSGISYSTDDGAIWDNVTGSDTAQFLAVDFVDAKHGWVGAFNTDATTGGMYYYHGNDFIVDPCASFTASFSVPTHIVDLNVSGQLDFTDMTTGTPTTWDWSFNGTSSSTTQNPSYTFTTTGDFYVTLEAGDGSCTSTYTDTIHVINTAGITALDNQNNMEIWPSPASSVLNIQSASVAEAIYIYNSNGNMVYTATASQGLITIDLSGMADGLYYIRVSTNGKFTDGKFIIRR